jgi:1-acyl-sn-glycerol-3-phosphate acyltransferase
LRCLCALLIRFWLRVYHRLAITGLENLPERGPFVVVANHTSHLDAPCLLSSLPVRHLHRAYAAAADDYFFATMPRLVAAAVVVNALPFDRKLDPRSSLDLCRRMLEDPGIILIFFPEGTRSLTGEVGEFRAGIGYLLAGSGIQVVPCYLDGTHSAWPKGAGFPKPARIQLRIGSPLEYSRLTPGKDSAIRISNELREKVLALADEARAHIEIAALQESTT